MTVVAGGWSYGVELGMERRLRSIRLVLRWTSFPWVAKLPPYSRATAVIDSSNASASGPTGLGGRAEPFHVVCAASRFAAPLVAL